MEYEESELCCMSLFCLCNVLFFDQQLGIHQKRTVATVYGCPFVCCTVGPDRNVNVIFVHTIQVFEIATAQISPNIVYLFLELMIKVGM